MTAAIVDKDKPKKLVNLWQTVQKSNVFNLNTMKKNNEI